MYTQHSISLPTGTASYLQKPADGASLTILMIHGNSLSKETFLPQLTSGLLDDYRLIALDLPGHGETKVNNSSAFSLPMLAEFIREFAENVIDEEILLTGHSLGGHLCIQAASGISNVRGFFLMGTPPLTSELAVAPFQDHPVMELLFKDELDHDELDMIVNAMQYHLPEAAETIKAALLKSGGTLRSALGRSVASGEYKDELQELRRIGIPSALVLGEKDALIHADYVENIAKLVGWQNKLHCIPSAGHTVQLEAPESVNNLIAEYIAFLGSEER
ncbi:MAG: alpha/beta fold hydrolase [Balneolaceae bacterium]